MVQRSPRHENKAPGLGAHLDTRGTMHGVFVAIEVRHSECLNRCQSLVRVAMARKSGQRGPESAETTATKLARTGVRCRSAMGQCAFGFFCVN